MAFPLSRCFRRIAMSLQLETSFCNVLSSRFSASPAACAIGCQNRVQWQRERRDSLWIFRNFSHGTVKLVICEGIPKFETQETDPPRREKWKTKKRLKLQRKREKQERKAANKRDPRCLTVKRKKKKKFANAEERIKYKLENARIKESSLLENLAKLEDPEVHGPVVQPHELTGEERFYLKKMGQKRSNYVPVGRRGIFGGVILNMHMHWKKHETVKVFCKPCKPGQINEYAQEIARLSGGIPIQIIGDDTIIFFRGKNYEQPEVMSPIGTLSKKKALMKSKYEQSLESVRHLIAVAEQELELYRRHIFVCGNSKDPNVNSTTCTDCEDSKIIKTDDCFSDLSGSEYSTTDQELSDTENELKDAGQRPIESEWKDDDYSSGENANSSHGDREGCFVSW